MAIIKYFILILLFPAIAYSTPSVSATGSATHGDPLIIEGSGFLTKSPAAPIWFDNCEGGTVDDPSDLTTADIAGVISSLGTGNIKYTEARPASGEVGGETAAQPHYDTVYDGVAQPHTRSSQYIAGYHEGSNTANVVAVVVSPRAFSGKFFIMWYLRLGDEWQDVTWDSTSNYKELWIEDGDGGPDWNTKSNDVTFYSTGDQTPYDSSDTLSNLEGAHGLNTNNYHVPVHQWAHREAIYDSDNEHHSYRSLNGSTIINHNCSGGACVGAAKDLTSKAVVSIGAFGTRINTPVAFTDDRMIRYFDDIYVDTTYSRVMLGNASTIAASTILEPQPPTAWATDEITVTVNLGGLPTSGTVYLFVFDSTNTGNATGYAVTIGETEVTAEGVSFGPGVQFNQ